MEYVTITFSLARQAKILRCFQTCAVTSGPLPAQIIPRVNVLEFRAQNPRMNVIQPAVKAETMHIALVRTMIAQLPDGRIHLLIVCHQRPAITEGPQVFLDDKTRRGRIAQFGDLKSVAMRPNPLRVVFNDV